VNEVYKDGSVVHLTSFKTSPDAKQATGPVAGPSKPNDHTLKHASGQGKEEEEASKTEAKSVSDAEILVLRSIFDQDIADGLLEAYQKVQSKTLGSGFKLPLGIFNDKGKRTELHKV